MNRPSTAASKIKASQASAPSSKAADATPQKATPQNPSELANRRRHPFSKWRNSSGGGSKRWGAVAVAVPSVALLGVIAASGAYSTWSGSHLIAPGVTIAGEPVGGLTKEQAVDRLEKRFERLFVTINTEKRPFVVSLKELGGDPAVQGTVSKAYAIGRQDSWLENLVRVYGSRSQGERMSLPVVWNKDALVQRLRVIDSLSRERAKNARLVISSRGVQIIPEKKGRALNLGETARIVQAKYYVGLKSIDAVSKEVDPRLTVDSLSGQDVELARYTTRFNAGLRGRTANIRVAASSIEGSVLMPGEDFSFNSKTGERTFDKGYRMAHIFQKMPGETESEVVDGLAGGTCQVSSTLYNAVLRLNSKTDGGLKITERHHHSLPVTYVPDGRDATVAWPYLDFKFRNTMSHPVYLRTAVEGSRLTVSVWGRVSPSAASTTPVEGQELSPVPVED